MGLNYYASSPTVVLPPQQPTHYFAGFNPSHHHTLPPSSMSNFRPKYPTPPSLNYLAAPSNATAGRKRSIADVDDPEENSPDGSIMCKMPPKPKTEPIYGPGMTLIYPDEPHMNIAAESQTGTWCEEKHEKLKKVAPPVRPIAMSRKSQRLDYATEVKITSMQASSESIIDDNGNTVDTLMKSLGVGWKNIMTNSALRDAARAYSRVIENHFDLSEPLIMLKSEALSAYLVRAKQYGVQGYWLFDDSLQWGQLIGWSLNRTVQNLMARPGPLVEGDRIESRPRTPPSEASTPPSEDVEMSAPKDITMADDDVMQL
ncbi:hypothetical protein K432DRAFT_385686 [Lepidopterella palustris CBS 459.81]|uniref:Uncharacterized protein n=1 Tax=Lepidopterella palustris CBS 459.81 TaxID=1314670 RepID=A0A8E2E2F4_9PEZI|nr:hypothetical protein K432DRAFT_385686 [Lepidopterella palustris CBS 459.81]